jgi:hypothetical protein
MEAPTNTAPMRDAWADALCEAREVEGLSLEERYALLADACRLVFLILEGHPDREAILGFQEPLPPGARALRDRARRRRPSDG